jgi:hypothetical protein
MNAFAVRSANGKILLAVYLQTDFYLSSIASELNFCSLIIKYVLLTFSVAANVPLLTSFAVVAQFF